MDFDLSYRKAFEGKRQSVVLNCGDAVRLPDGRTLGSFQSGLFRDGFNGDKLIVVEVGDNTEVTEAVAEMCRRQWKSAYETFGLDEFRGLDFYCSPRKELGELAFSFFYFGGNTPGSIHREHDFFELHTQVLGTGEMQKFRENDEKTLYEGVKMAPGYTHQPFFNSRGNYPWHRYRSVTKSILLAIESPKPIPGR
jgi:hypothetical protein